MIREKSFEGTTRGEAEQLATDWIKSQRGIRVTNRRAIATDSGHSYETADANKPSR